MKFDSPLAKTLYESVMEGYCDDEQGDLSENGTVYYLFTDFEAGNAEPLHAILLEDDAGNVFADIYPSKESAQQAWDEQYQELEQDAEPLSLEDEDDDTGSF